MVFIDIEFSKDEHFPFSFKGLVINPPDLESKPVLQQEIIFTFGARILIRLLVFILLMDRKSY
jgi:hypothetical protein